MGRGSSLNTSCKKEEEISNDSNTGLLKKVEGVVEGNFVDWTSEITYDDNQNISSIQFMQGGFSSVTYNVDYNNGVVRTLSIKQEFLNTGTESNETYTVDYIDDQIVLTTPTMVEKYILQVNDGYINSYKDWVDVDNDYFNEVIFIRDAQNNIDTISYFVTNEMDDQLLLWQYTFSDFENDRKVNSAFNPVYNYAFSLYNPNIGLALGLQLSKDTLLKSSLLSANGDFIEENILGEIIEENNNLPLKFQYMIHNLPNSNYRHDFEYY